MWSLMSSKSDRQVKQTCFCYRSRRFCEHFPARRFTNLAVIGISLWFMISVYLNLIHREQETREAAFGTTRTRPRILCYVLLSQANLRAGKVIQRTWGSDCEGLVFYGHFNYSSDGLNITYINAKEGYPYLWNKTKAALLHLDNHYASDYDWFIKADDDTFVIVENLRRFVRNVDFNQPLWSGFKLRSSRTKHAYMSGGAGYLFSAAALKQVTGLLQANSSRREENDFNGSTADSCNAQSDIGYEDLELGKCFNDAGVQALSSVDSKGRHKFLPLPLTQLLNDEVSALHWLRYQSLDALKFGRLCCSPSLITFHKISPNEMNALYFLLQNAK